MAEDIDPRLKLFRWDLNALVRWERATGRPIEKANPASLSDFRTMIWAGIEAQVPGLTEDDVGRMVTTRNGNEVRKLIDEVIQSGQPNAEAKNP